MIFTMPPKKKVTIDDQIKKVLTEMENHTPGTEPYRKLAEDLKVLYETRANKNPYSLSADTVVYALVNLAGIVMVLNFEKTGSITSNAFKMLFKGGRGS